MFNIQKQGSSLLITSSDNTQFPWKDGKMSIPMNSITYVIDESDYIAFRSAANNDILFTANINEIQINGSLVGKDDFIMSFDRVANSTASGGGGGSEPEQYVKMLGQESSNNLIWYMNQSDDYREIKFKTINGNPIIGDGNITIEGGEGGSTSAGVEAINLGREVQDWTQKTGIVTMYTDWYNGGYDVGINGTSFFGIKPLDDSIILEYAGGTVNGNSRCGIKINPDVLGGGSAPEKYIESINDFHIVGKEGGYKSLILDYTNGDGNNLSASIQLEWTGTQSEYDAIADAGGINPDVTYYIIEG